MRSICPCAAEQMNRGYAGALQMTAAEEVEEVAARTNRSHLSRALVFVIIKRSARLVLRDRALWDEGRFVVCRADALLSDYAIGALFLRVSGAFLYCWMRQCWIDF